MTSDELRSILDDLGWSQQMLAAFARRDYSRTRKQVRGAYPIDEPLAVWLRAIAALVRTPPEKPNRYFEREQI